MIFIQLNPIFNVLLKLTLSELQSTAVLILLSERKCPLICRHDLNLHDVNVIWFKVLSMMPFHNYLLISNFMISVSLLFLWLKNVGHTGSTISPCSTPLWKLPPLRIRFLWDVLISKFINYSVCVPWESTAFCDLWHEIKPHHNGTLILPLPKTWQWFTCFSAKNVIYKAGRCALSQSCCVLSKARVLPEAELFEGLEPLLFAM